MPGIQATTLTNVNISDTFYGLLHAGGQNVPATGQAQIYDGNGNTTALKLGVNCNGATICGGLSASSLSATSLSLTTPILSSVLPTVSPSVVGTYTGYLTSIDVTSKGIVTRVSTTQTPPLPYKAYALVNFTELYNRNAPQGSYFEIVGNNIASVTWLETGFYRVAFTTPMSNVNYVPFLQPIISSLSGVRPLPSNSVGSETRIVTFRALNFFEFTNQLQDSNDYDNMRGCGILII